MDDKWQKVREVFDSAIRRKPEERPQFVAEACGADKSLLAEVESLLSSLGSAEEFLETPVAAQIADIIKPAAYAPARGTLISHYEIIEKIGEGGMGEVYLAKDTNLNRKVALKLLAAHITEDKTRVARFRQEAFATSALNHPNIVTIYEIGKWENRDYIVTEFVEGSTLRAYLKKKNPTIGEALDIAIQIASALTAAHDAGIVHRDIKPENVMLRADGLVKVLDFGIAKYRPTENGQKALVETEVGEIIGTAAYMSPEQARGQSVDAQTDIWSLGVILYEMLAGRLPFQGATKSDRIAAILEREPELLTKKGDKTAPLQEIINRALAKDKTNRYANISDIAEDLNLLRETTGNKRSSPLILPRRKSPVSKRASLLAAVSLLVLIGGAIGLWLYFSNSQKNSAAERKSITVLPLKPIGAGVRDEIYEVGIADSLINRLGSMNGFLVRPLSAIRKYAAVEQDPIAAGREQQTDYVLASNYQLSNGRIRITAQLFNVANGQIEETYKGEKDASDLFKMQDAVAGEIGNVLLARFATTSGNPTTNRGTDNEEAYRLYLQGMYLYDRRTKADAYKAVEVLEQAVRIDPNFARAWAGLAHAHSYLINLGGVNINIPEQRQISTEAVNKALALDKNVSEAYSAQCDNKMYYEYDFAGAETACKRAIELKPDSAMAHNTYTRFLMSRGRFDEAVSEIKTAIDIEPTSYFHQVVYAICLAQACRYDEAFRQMDRLAELNPNTAFGLYWGNNGALLTQESPAKAFERTIRYLKLGNTDEQTIRLYETAYQTDGFQGVMREYAREISENPQGHIFLTAVIYAQLGNNDKAIELLEKSYERREFWMAYLQVEPRLDSLRGDARFTDLLRRVNFPQ